MRNDILTYGVSGALGTRVENHYVHIVWNVHLEAVSLRKEEKGENDIDGERGV